MAKVLKQSPLNKLTRTSHVAEQYSRMSSPIDTITGKIVRRTLRLLLEIEGFGQQGVDPAEEREGEVWQLVEKASDCVKKLIEDPHQLGKRPTLSDLEERQWEIHAGNFHSEYMYVAGQIFSDGINWGRIVALLGFASTYSLYAMDRGIDQSAVESVCGWTIVFMERELGGWLRQNSWEEFVNYADRILLARRRNELDTPVWQRVATIGALGLGAVLVFSIRNALS